MWTRIAGIGAHSLPSPAVEPARAGGRWPVRVAVAVLVAVLGTVVMSAPSASQTGDDPAEQVRIVARKLADGRIEFGLQQHRDGSWGERLLPARRFFPAAATTGRWLQSSPLAVGVVATAHVTPSDVEMRIVARRLADGRTEFGLQLRQHDTTWGERLEPARRIFPADTAAGRWLVSTPLGANLPPRSAKGYQMRQGAAGLVDIQVSGLSVCGLHSDGTVTCWGSDRWAQCEPKTPRSCGVHASEDHAFTPAGTFTAIAGSTEYWGDPEGFLALRSDGTLTCWYASVSHNGLCSWPELPEGGPELPEGAFRAISAMHSRGCGIRSEGTVLCWTEERSEQLEGAFTAISADGICGLRANGTVACPGLNAAEVPAPAGTFTSISAGNSGHVCGVRTGGTVACWGQVIWDESAGTETLTYLHSGERFVCGRLITDGSHSCSPRSGSDGGPAGNAYGQANPPGGTFTAVSAGGTHTCGLRTDGTATCWGDNSDGQAAAPGGTFTAITAGRRRTCGLRTDGTATCWGVGIVSPPAGTFTAISAGVTHYFGNPDHTCGVRTDGTITCWGLEPPVPPGGTFTAVTTSIRHACGLRTNGTATCWGQDRYGQTKAPGGTFATISTGETHTCGLRTNGTATCWGGNRRALREAPGGTFTALEAGPFHTCGLRTNGTLDCWGYGYTTSLSHGGGTITPPSGAYAALSTGDASCALRSDGTVTCWPDDTDTPDGTYSHISDSSLHACGIRTDGTVNCWTVHFYGNHAGQADAPAGTFLATTAGMGHTCGIRENHTLTCWGDVRGGHAVWHITGA